MQNLVYAKFNIHKVVFGMTKPGIEPATFRTGSKHSIARLPIKMKAEFLKNMSILMLGQIYKNNL